MLDTDPGILRFWGTASSFWGKAAGCIFWPVRNSISPRCFLIVQGGHTAKEWFLHHFGKNPCRWTSLVGLFRKHLPVPHIFRQCISAFKKGEVLGLVCSICTVESLWLGRLCMILWKVWFQLGRTFQQKHVNARNCLETFWRCMSFWAGLLKHLPMTSTAWDCTFKFQVILCDIINTFYPSVSAWFKEQLVGLQTFDGQVTANQLSAVARNAPIMRYKHHINWFAIWNVHQQFE